MKVTVEYLAPVLVLVDTDARRIESVIVADEDVRKADQALGWLDDEERASAEVTDAAYAIVEAAEWPAWELGL